MRLLQRARLCVHCPTSDWQIVDGEARTDDAAADRHPPPSPHRRGRAVSGLSRNDGESGSIALSSTPEELAKILAETYEQKVRIAREFGLQQ